MIFLIPITTFYINICVFALCMYVCTLLYPKFNLGLFKGLAWNILFG